MSYTSRPPDRATSPLVAWATAYLMGCSTLVAACTQGTGEREGNPLNRSIPSDVEVPVRAEAQPPWWRLEAGSRYFERDGTQAPVLMRNVSAATPAAFVPLFRDARKAGTSVVRLQVTQGFGYSTLGMDSSGSVLSGWASSWDEVLSAAEAEGLGVIVVFTLWGDWNDGTPALGWSHFDANPLNAARGGPAASPADLFADTETQRRWFSWLSSLVQRWSSRPNVIAWELFSELDLATGADEANALQFVERAYQLARGIDPWRPIFASTSDLPLIDARPWQALWNSASNDIASVHPYAPDLDRVALDRLRSIAPLTTKPLLVAESGLDAGPPEGQTLSLAPRAGVGLGHAIWAELVSGAMSARAFYWEDGYAVYYPGSGLPLVTRQNDLERQPARWLAGKDFRDRHAVAVSGEPAVFGAALVSDSRVSGWARNGQLAPPEWNAPALAGARLEVALPANSPQAVWSVLLTDPADGSQTEVAGKSMDGVLAFSVDRALDSVAFEAMPAQIQTDSASTFACTGSQSEVCAGSQYSLVLDGQNLSANTQCLGAVDLTFTSCRDALWMDLKACPAVPRSCVNLRIFNLRGQRDGMGVYYDAAGVPFDLVVREVQLVPELTVENQNDELMRSGVLRGDLTLSDGASRPFELSFRACSQRLVGCLI